MTLDWRQMPSLTALRAFEATARLSGFSQAARELNVTHAAVAQQVRGLEAELGVALVLRQGRSLALTMQGERLAAALADGFGAIQGTIAALRGGDADRPVRVTLTSAFASEWLMPKLRDFWQKHPEIAVSLHPDPRPLDLRRDGMDLGIRYGRGKWPGVETRLLTSARLVVASVPALLPHSAPLSVDELSALPWVLTSDWVEQHNWLQSIGLDPTALQVAEFPSEELAIAAARQGMGLVVMDRALLEDDLTIGRMVLAYDREDPLPAYFIATPPGPLRRPAKLFLDWLIRWS